VIRSGAKKQTKVEILMAANAKASTK